MNKNKIKKILCNKKGFTDAITVVPIVLAAMALIVFFINLTSYAQKYLAVKKATDTLLKIICAQGHVTQNIPDYFPGASVDGMNIQDDQYWVRNEMVSYMEDVFKRAGINDFNISVTFDEIEGGGSKTITNLKTQSLSTGGFISKYNEKITVKVTYKFKWSTGMISNVGVSRVGLSEYSYRTGEWSSQ